MLLVSDLLAVEAARRRIDHVSRTGVVLITAVRMRRCQRSQRSLGAFTDRQSRYTARLAASGYDGVAFQDVVLGARHHATVLDMFVTLPKALVVPLYWVQYEVLASS